MKETERWKAVVGFEGLYEVSDHGGVRSVDRITRHGRRLKGKLLGPGRNSEGYLQVDLQRDGRRSTRQVHRLVAAAFLGQLAPGAIVRHLNDVADDNRLENLAVGTHSDNRHDSVRNGTHYFAGRTQCPRGHVLAGENLRPTALRAGRRECLACARARSWLSGFHGYTEQVFQAVSDAYYFRLMGWLPESVSA